VAPVEVYEGWLCFGLSPETLQRQWFVLQDELVYYNQQQEPRVQEGALVLEGCTVSIGTSSLKNCFELQSESKTYYMVADDAVQMQEWMTNIRKVALRIRRQRTTSLSKKNVVERRNFAQEGAEGGAAVPGAADRGVLESEAPPEPKPADDRLGVYKQWLEETKAKGAKGETGSNDVLARQLLSESENVKHGKGRCGKLCPCCSSCCVVC